MINRNEQINALLASFHEKAWNPAKNAEEWKKKTGGKVVGCIGLDVPEPLIHAAGMLPVVLLEKDEAVTTGAAHVEMHMCGYIRSIVDQVTKGQLAYCDEIVAHDCCHVVRMICDAMHTFSDTIPKVKFLYFSPLLEKKTAQEYTMDELKLFRSRLEEITGTEITDEKLSASIAVFNRQRELLIKVYDIRRQKPGILSGLEVADIVAAGMSMAKEDHIEMLEKLIPLLETEEAPDVSGKKKVIVHGSLCERCDNYVIECIENAGGVIVDDDLYVGSKYFNTLYKTELAPLDALLDAYCHRVSPCPTRYDSRNAGEYLDGMMKKAGAAAAVMVVVKFCEAHDFAYFNAFRYFEKNNIKQILVETEHGSEPVGQLMTRLEGFFESMEEL